MNCPFCKQSIKRGDSVHKINDVWHHRDCALYALEAQLAEANEAARLQRAIDRIKKAGYVPNLGYSVEYGGIFEVEVTVRAFGPPGDEWRLGEEHLFCAFSDAEAAEQAADWAESQKDPAHE